MSQRLHRRDHEFLVAAVIADAADDDAGTVNEVSSAAGQTCAVLAAVPTHADAIAFFPTAYPGSHFINHAGDLMPRNARIGDAGKQPVLSDHIAMTHATG